MSAPRTIFGKCPVAQCGRALSVDSKWICGRCLRLVDAGTKLALEDHREIIVGDSKLRFFAEDFLRWSWGETAAFALAVAFVERFRRRSPAYEPWSEIPPSYIVENARQRLDKVRSSGS